MLKKFSVIVISILLIICLFLFNRAPVVDGANEYEVYLKSYSDERAVKKVDKQDFMFLIGVKGESYTISNNDFCLEQFLSDLNAKVIFTENLPNMVSYYGYSPNIKYLQMVKSNLINIHIAVSKSCVKVGFPMIYGSF